MDIEEAAPAPPLLDRIEALPDDLVWTIITHLCDCPSSMHALVLALASHTNSAAWSSLYRGVLNLMVRWRRSRKIAMSVHRGSTGPVDTMMLVLTLSNGDDYQMAIDPTATSTSTHIPLPDHTLNVGSVFTIKITVGPVVYEFTKTVLRPLPTPMSNMIQLIPTEETRRTLRTAGCHDVPFLEFRWTSTQHRAIFSQPYTRLGAPRHVPHSLLLAKPAVPLDHIQDPSAELHSLFVSIRKHRILRRTAQKVKDLERFMEMSVADRTHLAVGIGLKRDATASEMCAEYARRSEVWENRAIPLCSRRSWIFT
jgi:hypothetical protein